jgi:hypothetical protein
MDKKQRLNNALMIASQMGGLDKVDLPLIYANVERFIGQPPMGMQPAQENAPMASPQPPQTPQI